MNAEPLVQLTPGTIWEYLRTGAEPAAVTVRVAGKEQSAGKELFKIETLVGTVVTRTDFVTLDERGLLSHARIGTDGKRVTLDPPQTLIPAKLQTGAKWELDDEVAGTAMRQKFSVVGEEEVVVPAGSFRAFRLRCEEPWPISVTIDRWFAPGTGVVKEVVTTRGPTGRLMSRVAMSLQKIGLTAPAPEATPKPRPTPVEFPSPRITLEVAKDREGEAQTAFKSDVPNIFVRWSGENLPANAYVRVAWIAEDVGDLVEKDFIVDETETEVTSPDFGARFTLSRPKDGWAPGKYRVELYLEEELAQTVHVTIND